jgi:transposase
MTGLTIGIDIAKRVFQVHAIDNETGEVTSTKLARRDFLAHFQKLSPSLIGMETCGSAHHWARELSAIGHEVRLMNPMYVKPYVKRGKNDVVDAEAICEAMTRPTMRFVAVKTVEQQSLLAVHRTRALLIRQRTMLVNALRGHLAEFGVVAPVGIERIPELIGRVMGREGDEVGITPLVRSVVAMYAEQIEKIKEQIRKLERELRLWHRTSEASRRVASVPGVGTITATAIVAAMPDPSMFESGRGFAAWLGLTPKSSSSGGKERNGRITKAGDRHIRVLLVLGATSVLRRVRSGQPTPLYDWVKKLLDRKPPRLATVALANKMARIAWAVMARKMNYQPELAAAVA